jgi:chemotaxis family two-component system response regulator Rcp1
MAKDRWPWRILLIEDNPIDQKMVKRSLKQKEIECDLTVIDDGEEAVQFITRLDNDEKILVPDLVLLDINLPRHDGLEILKTLRATERGGLVPVIIMTASPSADKLFKSAKRNAPSHTFEKKADYESYMELGTMVEQVLKEKISTHRRRA